MTDTTKMKVGEIKELLIKDYGMSQEDVDSIVGKGAVAAKLHELESGDEEILNDVQLENSVRPETVEDSDTPTMSSPDWTKYVLSKMTPDELMDGHPTVDGLRRMVDLLMGTVVIVGSDIAQTPDLNNNFHATVKVTVVLEDGTSVDGCADAGGNNCKQTYAIHPVAMAESRAESRAYRRLLRLKNIISAEETVSQDEIIDAFESISSAQTKIIDKICSKMNINVEKWLATRDIKLEEYKKLTKSAGADLCSALNTLQGAGAVPDSIIGYNIGWDL